MRYRIRYQCKALPYKPSGKKAGDRLLQNNQRIDLFAHVFEELVLILQIEDYD